jgi:hypothetical protein
MKMPTKLGSLKAVIEKDRKIKIMLEQKLSELITQ